MSNPIIRVDTPLYEYGKKAYSISIYLFQQWFISKNENRHEENVYVLKKNIENPAIDKIYFLNERYYTWDEMGVPETEKIEQIIVSERLTYGIAWNTIRERKIDGYCILANLDIFFDEQLHTLKYSDYHMSPVCITGNRRDYYLKQDVSLNDTEWKQLKNSAYTVPTVKGTKSISVYQPEKNAYVVPYAFLSECTKDVWIIHSTWIRHYHLDSTIQLGTNGCDNKIMTYLYQKNIEFVNCSFEIPMYHYHTTQYRTYSTASTNGIYTFVHSPLTLEQRYEIYRIAVPFIRQGVYNTCSKHVFNKEKPIEEKISYGVWDYEKMISYISLHNTQKTPFYFSYLDIPTSLLSKLFVLIQQKNIKARELDTNMFDGYELLLYRLIVQLYFIKKKKFGILLDNETISRDLDFLSSMYSYLHSNEKYHDKLHNMMVCVKTSIEQSDGILFNHHHTIVANNIIFQKINHGKFVEHILKHSNVLMDKALNPIFFHNRACWTHSLSGQRIGILSRYSKEIQENRRNWYTCYNKPLFMRNKFSFMELPPVELRQIHHTYTTIIGEVSEDTSEETHQKHAHDLYQVARMTMKTKYLEYIQYSKKVEKWLENVDVLLLDTSMMNSFFMDIAIKTKTSCIVLGDLLRLYFGVYTQQDMDWYTESMWVVNDSWKKV